MRFYAGSTSTTAASTFTRERCTSVLSTRRASCSCTGTCPRAGAFLHAVAPFRDGLVVAVECMFTWYWLADLCAEEGIPFVLGHALYMKAIHGGKAKNDRIDAEKIAKLLRGGIFPQAYVYPRRCGPPATSCGALYLVRQRSELLSHVQTVINQYNLPDLEDDHFRATASEILDVRRPASQRASTADFALIDIDQPSVARAPPTARQGPRSHASICCSSCPASARSSP